MEWLARKLDMLGGAVCAGIAGATTSQLDAFVQQYLQRLGGHLDELKRLHDSILSQDRYRQLDQPARDLLIGDTQGRLDQIAEAFRALSAADPLARPFVFLANLDLEIAARTLEQFRPAVPADLAGLIYAGAGLVLGLIAYELVKWPFAALFGGDRRKRGPVPRL